MFLLAAHLCFAFGVLLVSCKSDDPSDAPASVSTSRVDQGAVVQLSASEVRDIQSNASVFQYDLMRDGTLTFSKYEKAFFAMVECVEAAGLTLAERPQLTADENYYLLIWYRDQAEIETGQPKADRCRLEYFEYVNRTWARADPRRFESLYASARADLVACAREAGLDLAENATDDDLHVYRDAVDPAYFRCVKTIQESHRIPGWAP